jgi:hypothetical protein
VRISSTRPTRKPGNAVEQPNLNVSGHKDHRRRAGNNQAVHDKARGYEQAKEIFWGIAGMKPFLLLWVEHKPRRTKAT